MSRENERPLLESAEFISPHKKRYDGHFQYQFDDGNFTLGGRSVSKTEALVRLGVMPHNNVLMNKVINALGERVLDLLRNAPDKDRKRVNDNFVYQTAAEEAELLGSWVMVEILSAVKPLEQLTGYLSDLDNSIILEKVKTQLDKLNTELSGYFSAQLGASEFSLELDRKLSAIITNAKERLVNYPKSKSSDQDHQTFQRDLLRTMMNDFEELQTDISIAQRGFSNLFSFANGTNTSATQKAYYAIQNHVYSAESVNSNQLWMQAQPTESAAESEERAADAAPVKKQLDTANYAGIRQEDALFAACLLEVANGNPSQKIDAAKKADVAAKQKINESHTALKTKIDKARGGVFGALGLFRDSDMENAQRFQGPELEKQGFWSGFYANPEEINQAVSMHQEQTEVAQTPVADAFAETRSAFVYKPGDLFSAMTNFSYEFGEYFSREMAAKHPGIATVGFALPSAYMASIALHGIGVAPHLMHAIYSGLSKALSVDGHLIDPNKITNAFATVTDKWLWLTKCHGTMETVMLTAFGGPKLTYLISEQVNKMLSGVPETTLSSMTKLFSTGNLDTQLAMDEARERLKTFLKTSMMLGFAIGLGIGVAALPHTFPGAAVAQNAVQAFDNVQASTFAAVMHGHGLAELGAIAQMTAEVKTAGLFLAKMMAVSHFLRKGHEEEDKAAIEYFKLMQQTAASKPDGGQAFLTEKLNDPVFQNAKKILEANIVENPMVKFLFGNNEAQSIAFLRECGVKETAKAPPFARMIAGAVKATPGVLTGFFTTTIGGVIGLPVFMARQIYSAVTGHEAVPDNAAARYLYKNAAKLLLGITKIAATVWFVAKFFGQALTGFIARVGSGLKEAGATVIELGRRVAAKDGNALGYLGNQLAKAAGSVLEVGSRTTKLLGFVAKAVTVVATIGLTATLILPLASVVAAGVRTAVGGGSFLEKLGSTFKAVYTAPLNAISALTAKAADFFSKPAEKMKDDAAKFEREDPYSVAKANTATAGAADEKPKSRNWFIRAKNAIGSGLAFVRDMTMRKLEHTLQVVAHKDQAKRMDVYRVESLAGPVVDNQRDVETTSHRAQASDRTLSGHNESVPSLVDGAAAAESLGVDVNTPDASAAPTGGSSMRPSREPQDLGQRIDSDRDRDRVSQHSLSRSSSSLLGGSHHQAALPTKKEEPDVAPTAEHDATPRVGQ